MTLLDILKKPVVPVYTKDRYRIRYWRERIFFILSMVSLYIGTVVYIISIYFAVQSNLHLVVVLDTIVYGVALMIFTVRSLPFNLRVNLFLVIIYFLGAGLLFIVGRFGAGNPWLFSFPIFAGVLLHHRGAIIALGMNIVTLVAFYFLIPVVPDQYLLSTYSKEAYLVTFVNFIGVNLVVTISLLILIRGLSKSLRNERCFTKSLKKERRRLAVLKQKAEESDRLKSAFLANISHEIRTPLNAIMGFVNIMSNYKLSKKEYESYANIINEEGDVLLNLINDLIDISAIESGQLKIKKEPVHLRKIMHNLYNIGEQQLHQKDKEHIQLKYTCDEKLDESILTDVTRLNQVLKNLIQNAIKYTNEGKIEFGYQYVNGYVQFFVKDTGIGIPESKKEYVFERFTQIENADNPPEGTGLGLAISKSLTELLGGTIDFDSSQYGTVFFLTVPMS